jgi:transcriptional regulator with XRE-family HTH domain
MSTSSPRLALKAWRLRRAMTQAELASVAGLQRSTLIDIERGNRFPRPSTIKRLAEALRVTPEQLFEGP